MTSTTASAITSATVSERPTYPHRLELARRCVLVVAAIHLIALALIATHTGAFAASVAATHGDLGPEAVRGMARTLMLQSVVPHIVLAVVFILRARALRAGRRRTRTVLTVLLAVQMIAHATLPITLNQLPDYAPAVIAIQATSLAFEVSALVLLWSRSARDWYST